MLKKNGRGGGIVQGGIDAVKTNFICLYPFFQGAPKDVVPVSEVKVKADDPDSCVEREGEEHSSTNQNLDRGRVSSRAAFRTLASEAATRDEAGLSHTTLWRERTAERAERAAAIRSSFQPIGGLVAHWDGFKVATLDGKPTLDGKDLVER